MFSLKEDCWEIFAFPLRNLALLAFLLTLRAKSFDNWNFGESTEVKQLLDKSSKSRMINFQTIENSLYPKRIMIGLEHATDFAKRFK